MAANISGFGLLWVAKFLFLDQVMFGRHGSTRSWPRSRTPPPVRPDPPVRSRVASAAMPPVLDLTPDELLSTTRSVRKRLDLSRPVEPELIRECIELAAQAPTGGNAQGWHFVVVTDPTSAAGWASGTARASS